MTSEVYDVIVVGAGPAGSQAAYELASAGFSTAVLEQKGAPGLDICCTGIISTECFDSFGISPDVILGKANSVKLFSPSGRCLRLESEKVQAYIIDRASFDQAVARRARDCGVDYSFLSHVTDITIGKDKAEIAALCRGSREVFASRAILLANGTQPGLAHKLGLGRIEHFLIGAQIELRADNGETEVHFGRQVAPGSFAWVVPTAADRALVGLLSSSQATSHLEAFLLSRYRQGRMADQKARIRQKAIPLGILPRTFGHRVLVVGSAAGQVKPTTGGGIYFGHLGARIATEVLREALGSDDLSAARLSRYDTRWRAKMAREIRLGRWARQVYARLSDRQIERLFDMLDSGGMASALLNSPDCSFDWHSRLILTGLKYGLAHPVRKAWHFLSREARP